MIITKYTSPSHMRTFQDNCLPFEQSRIQQSGRRAVIYIFSDDLLLAVY